MTRRIILILLALLAPAWSARGQAVEPFKLIPCEIGGLEKPARCGTYWVYENRAIKSGRKIPLRVIILPSRSASPAPDPFWLVSPGGPGTTNSEVGLLIAMNSWWRDSRDVVIVDLRGTSGSNRLDCDAPSEDHPEGYITTLFPPAFVRTCHEKLAKVADLRLYTSSLVVQDLEEVRQALGYHQINLWGASWGTRAVLQYLRQSPAAIRSAIVESVAPPSLINPLPHARSAQQGIDAILDACAQQSACHAAFPNVRAELTAVVQRLKAHAVTVQVADSAGNRISATMTWAVFADALRQMTLGPPRSLRAPLLIHRAYLGDFDSFAAGAVASNRGLRSILRLGFTLSITCAEDVPRIDPARIPAAVAGTYMGDTRVREQMEACEQWGMGKVPAGYGDPVRSDVPVFLLSGTLDPATPPHYGTEAARYLSRSIHVIVPGGHAPRGECITAMERAFLEAASPRAVDTTCVRSIVLPPFAISDSS